MAIFISAIVGYLIILIEGKEIIITSEIISRTKPNILYLLVAIFSGLAGAYAYSKPKVSESITGIAISVAIIPPLAVIGLGIAIQNWELTSSSSVLFLLNLSGIFFGSIIMFLILGFGKEVQ